MIPLALIGEGAGAIAKKIPRELYISLGIILLLIGSHWYAFHRGEANTQAEWDKSIERGKALVADLKSKQGKIETKIIREYVPKVQVIHEKAKTIEKLVPVYIPIDTPDLPAGFRILHDASATNTVPSASSRVDAQPVPVKDVAETLNFNYELCHVEREKLKSLWKWASEQHHAYQELCKQPGVSCK